MQKIEIKTNDATKFLILPLLKIHSFAPERTMGLFPVRSVGRSASNCCDP